MMKEQLNERLEKLQREKFFLDMADHWSGADFTRAYKLDAEIAQVKKQLAEFGD